MTADEEFELKSRPKRGADLKSNLVVDSQTNAKDDLLKETKQKLENLGNLMAISKIQPKLKVVEKTIEPELTAIEKYIAQYIAQMEKYIAQSFGQAKIVAELKAEEKLKAQREDWLNLI